ncbi:MAG: prenyltransferase/squalene oxidase repeat-containing protein [Patescibacteria group bacterium]
MPKVLTKQLLTRLALGVASILIVMPAPVFADTNQDVQTAAQAGVQYLADNQAANGGITGLGGESDWSTIAIEASGQSAADFASGTGTSLTDYLKTDVLGAGTPATTIERRVIAARAADEDTSDFGGVDYNAQLASQHIGNQIGDPTLLNDDIFGVIAIDSIGDNSLLPMAQDGLDYLLAHQAADGGFAYTTVSCAWCGSDSNDTAAALIAMYAANDMGLTQDTTAKTNAIAYLLSTQQVDGGFGYDAFSPSDGSSTAWGLMALNTIGDSVTARALLARDWLLGNQNADGGFSFGAYGFTNSDTYTTAHAIVALLGSTWLLSPEPIGQPTQTGGKGGISQGPGNSTQTGQQQSVAISTTTSSSSSSVNSPTASQAAVRTSLPEFSGKDVKFDKQSTQPTTALAGVSSAKYTVYAVSLLSLVAAGWFMLESRKAKGVK